MGKHHRSPTKQQSSASASSVQQLRSIVAKCLSDSYSESSTQLKQWLMKFLPSIGIAATGTSQWREIRENICLDQKLLEKLVLLFQDARDSSVILLMSQLFGELLASKRAAKLLVQCGLTLAVLCQIRVCCCLSSNNSNSNNNTNIGNPSPSSHQWSLSTAGVPSTLAESINMSLSVSLSMQCSILGSSPTTNDLERQVLTVASLSSNNASGNNGGGLQCSPQVAIALHQLACRIFPLDHTYNTKARATGAILGTLLAAKSLFLDKKALLAFLCCIRLVSSLLPPRQSRLLKLAVDLLSNLLKSASNCARFVQSGGVNTLLATLENVNRTDARFRQLAVRRTILRCLLMASQVRNGRTAIVQSGAVQTLYQLAKELPSRPELDGMFMTAIGIIKNSAGPRRLPINNLYSPYSFVRDSSADSSGTGNAANSKVGGARRSVPQIGDTGVATTGTSSAGNNQKNPSTDDESVSPLDDESDEDYTEEADFVIRSYLRTDSNDDPERTDGGATGGDDSESDDDKFGNTAAGDAKAEAVPVAPLESDPVVLASYDMFFGEVRDLALNNTAMSENFVVSDNLATIIPGTNNNNNVNTNSSSDNNDFVTQYSIRTANTTTNANASNGQFLTSASMMISPPRRKLSNAGQIRKSPLNNKPPVFIRRSSELNVAGQPELSSSSASSYGYVTNSMTTPSFAVSSSGGGGPDSGRSSLLPLALIGEHINGASSERSSAPSSAPSPGINMSLGQISANRDAARYARICNNVKRCTIWQKIPFPCLHGFNLTQNPEPQLSTSSANIRRLVLADVDRFIQKAPPDLINEVMFDLDEIVAANSAAATENLSQAPPSRVSSSAGRASAQPPSPSLPPPIGNDDLQRIGRPPVNGDSSLQFNSLFECGNLRRAVRVREFEYDLILTPDVSTNHHLQWFYFEVWNTPSNCQPVRFNILNCEKPKSQYEKGMQVLAFSVTEAALGRPQWKRIGYDICYYKGYYEHPSGPLPLFSYYTMTFTIEFSHSYDIVYLAYHYPYSYSTLLYELDVIQNRVLPPDVYYTCQTLCMSEMSNAVPLITITSSVTNSNPSTSSSTLPGIQQPALQFMMTNNSTSSANQSAALLSSLSATCQNAATSSLSTAGPFYRTQQQRPYVIITSRVHPGETNSSWMMRGLLAFLLGDTPSARRARQSFVFKIVPMINVDGTVNGNHRCSLFGDDLNRSWPRPSPVIAPSIFHTKRLIAWLRFRRRPILCYLDFHGHSRKKNVFVLGCSPSQSWRRRDVANPAVDPITGEEDSRWHLLPYLLSVTSPAFSLQDCCFVIERAKEPTARVVLWRSAGLIASYTLEATFCGFDQGSYRGLQVNPLHLQEMGGDLCRVLEPLLASFGKCPNARYGEGPTTSQATAAQQNNNTSSTSSSLVNAPVAAGSSSTTAPRIAGGTLRNIALGPASSDDSSSSSSSSSKGDNGSDDDLLEDKLTRRAAAIATKNITFITKKY